MKTLTLAKPLCFYLPLFLSLSPKAVAQSISGVINSYHKVTAINTSTNLLTLTSTAGLNSGTKVLIIQMKGATIDVNNAASFGNITNIGTAGNYEFNHICAVSGNDVLLRSNLSRTYDPAAGSVQMIPVPQYNIVTITDTVRSAAWNSISGTGGIVVFEADTVLMNSAIDVRGRGFVGGAKNNFPTPTYDCNAAIPVSQFFMGIPTPGTFYSAGAKGEGIADFIANGHLARGKQANGGGGGSNHNAGGAGGGNYGAGGSGGTRSNVTGFNCTGNFPGVGGLSVAAYGYSIAHNRLFMGGGGGAGHENNNVGTPGGNGGGIAIVTANVIVTSGARSILANASRPYNPAFAADPFSSGGDGGGGGGAGGTIVLNVNEVIGSLTASATGSNGSNSSRTGASGDCPGPGGGGGGGVIWMKGAAPLANVTTVDTGGISGIVSMLSATIVCRGNTSGATDGIDGNTVTGFVPVQSGPFICHPLPVKELLSFTGKLVAGGVELQWSMRQTNGIVAYELQRCIDQVTYTTIHTRSNTGAISHNYTDETPFTGTQYYRLKILRSGAIYDYSAVVRISKYSNALLQWVNLHPNPATQQVTLSILAQKNMIINLQLFTSTGQQVSNMPYKVSSGYSTVTIPIYQLPPGVHWMVMEADGVRQVQRFVKKG